MNTCHQMETLTCPPIENFAKLPAIVSDCNVTDDAKLCQEMNNNIEKQCRYSPSKPVTATNIDTSNANTQPLSKRIFNLADKIRWIKTELVSPTSKQSVVFCFL